MQALNYIFSRLFIGMVTICGVAVIIFFAMRAMPSSFEEIVLGPISTLEARALVAKRFGLDGPMYEQFIRWFLATLRGDFGISMITQTPVAAEILRRAPVTVQLTLMATAFALIVGIPLGILSAMSQSHRVRAAARVVGAMGASIPDFVIGSVFLFIFSVWSLFLNIGGYVPFFEEPAANLKAMVLPALNLSVFGIALILRTTRDSVLRVLTEGHITTAVAYGQIPWKIIYHNALRNASIPIVTVTTTYFSYLLGGAVIVETMYSLPGIGLYTYNALHNRDYAVVQAGVLLAAFVFVTLNTLSDIFYAVIDPRIQTGQNGQ